MVQCSKCGIEVVEGQYFEIDKKHVCYDCYHKKNSEIKKVKDKKFPLPKLPWGVIVIIVLAFLSAVFSIILTSVLTNKVSQMLGFVFFAFFAVVGAGLIVLSNIARIAAIVVYGASFIFDIFFLVSEFDYAIIVRMVIAVCVIIYLLRPKIAKKFN